MMPMRFELGVSIIIIVVWLTLSHSHSSLSERPEAQQRGHQYQPQPHYDTRQPARAQPAPRYNQRPAANTAEKPINDPCGTIFISKQHGFQIREYKIITKDHYELKLHRILHPSDIKRLNAAAALANRQQTTKLDPYGRPISISPIEADRGKLNKQAPQMIGELKLDKKPYLLLHGLVGSSASFIRNINKDYRAPGFTYDANPSIDAILKHRFNEYEYNWQSTADRLNAAFKGDNSNTIDKVSFKQKLTNSFKKITFAQAKQLDFNGDSLNFAREFEQAYRKFHLPRDSSLNPKDEFITNSLAFTLSNFGYDVWLINLRGNQYSRGYNGPLNANEAEYWDFNLDQLVKQDLLASIEHVRRTSGLDSHQTMGIVSYSYSSLYILGLLTKYPHHQNSLQPIIMLAPTLLTPTERNSKLKYFIQMTTKHLISHTGPFPARKTSKKIISLDKIVCKLPIASKLCNLMTIILHGESKSVKEIISFDDREKSLMLKDSECGQTSTGVLHQIVRNLSQHQLMPDYQPFINARDKILRGTLRRSIMIIHSEADEISTPAEVARIQEASVKGMTLAQITIKESAKFGHTDFLFSKKNQYLVNAEVARMALVFDFMLKRESAARKIERARGY